MPVAYRRFFLSEKTIRIKTEKPEEEIADRQALGYCVASREYRSYKKFFFYLYEKGLSLHKAAAELMVPQSAVQGWKKKFEDGDNIFTRKEGSGRPRGRLAILNEEHQNHLLS
ncbi:hypothetical protein BCV72DRAFT_338617 [Rhizopus microsporus var. microsporus]|uniref:Uncharacterized protein n=1 Tax=Rhizopus microsporus var. microsporus TaxID=86635 RepID=A0A1X0QS50_RHIZD|nr:hypothetical protein BCV72DRAFT_338617 [Rhizopus microsporus var. microsporus]